MNIGFGKSHPPGLAVLTVIEQGCNFLLYFITHVKQTSKQKYKICYIALILEPYFTNVAVPARQGGWRAGKFKNNHTHIHIHHYIDGHLFLHSIRLIMYIRCWAGRERCIFCTLLNTIYCPPLIFTKAACTSRNF